MFTINEHIDIVKQSNKTKQILIQLYNDIIEAYSFLQNLKRYSNYYSVTTKKIFSAIQITKPKTFNNFSFPTVVRSHIDEMSISEICYTFSLYDREIKVFFITEEDNIELKIDTYNKYVDIIIMWLYILNIYSSKECVNTLCIYLYFTSLKKNLPPSNIFVLDETNVNTAFTTTCPRNSEIVIFRKEEWFKVLIHETFHNFGLDFSDMNNEEVHRFILNIFNVNSNVNLYEAYTEFWAEIINALFCSFFSLKNKADINEFLSNSEIFINFERTYSFFQLVKTLNFMGLTYQDLYLNTKKSRILRENLYKENSNVLSYYIIKTILINNYQDFLYWCKSHNFSLLQFKKTLTNQREFYKFIEKNYKSTSMINGIKETTLFYKKIQKKYIKNKKTYNELLHNLRMSICELG